MVMGIVSCRKWPCKSGLTWARTPLPHQENRTREQKGTIIIKMALSFPNQSRSYDARRRCVRFWAYDDVLEISFFVEEDALCRIDSEITRSEAEFLNSFDLHRDRIFKAAGRVYSRHGKASYTLAISDLQ